MGNVSALILFLTRLGHSVGLGNASRVRSVALALADTQHDVTIVMVDPDRLASAFDWRGLSYVVEISRSAALATVHRIAESSAHLILVADEPNLDANYSRNLRTLAPRALVSLAVAGCAGFSADLLISGHPEARELPNSAAEVVAGLDYLVVRPEIVDCRPRTPSPGGQISSVLVAMEGTDSFQRSESLATWATSDGLSVTLLSGHRAPSVGAASPQERPWIDVQGLSGRDLADLYLGHDVVVTQGGLTAVEALCLGRRVVCVGPASDAGFSAALSEVGFAAYINSGVSIPRAQSWLNCQDWSSMVPTAHSMIDGRGAERIAAVIAEVEFA